MLIEGTALTRHPTASLMLSHGIAQLVAAHLDAADNPARGHVAVNRAADGWIAEADVADGRMTATLDGELVVTSVVFSRDDADPFAGLEQR